MEFRGFLVSQDSTPSWEWWLNPSPLKNMSSSARCIRAWNLLNVYIRLVHIAMKFLFWRGKSSVSGLLKRLSFHIPKQTWLLGICPLQQIFGGDVKNISKYSKTEKRTFTNPCEKPMQSPMQLPPKKTEVILNM